MNRRGLLKGLLAAALLAHPIARTLSDRVTVSRPRPPISSVLSDLIDSNLQSGLRPDRITMHPCDLEELLAEFRMTPGTPFVMFAGIPIQTSRFLTPGELFSVSSPRFLWPP